MNSMCIHFNDKNSKKYKKNMGKCLIIKKEEQNICGAECPFRRTLEEQEAIEKKCYERLKKVYPKYVYLSCLTGKPYEESCKGKI